MAFNFGSTTATPNPAPAPGGFSFGSSSTPAPAPSTGFSFGAPAPATSTFGSAFGATPATPAFGAAPAPATAFGAAPATAFGAAPATTFGAAPATAFGAAPATAFGAAPAPTLAFGAASSPFGVPPPTSPFGATGAATSAFGVPTIATAPYAFAAPTTPAAPPIIANAPYATVAPQAKAELDKIYEVMMKHKRTMNQVKTMAPALLRSSSPAEPPSSPADVAAGTSVYTVALQQQDSTPFSQQLHAFDVKLTQLSSSIEQCKEEADKLKHASEQASVAGVKYAEWPVEALAARRGVTLTQPAVSRTANWSEVDKKLSELLDRQAAAVDRIEDLPSPYLWQVIHNLEERIGTLADEAESLKNQTALSEKAADVSEPADWSRLVLTQRDALYRIEGMVSKVNSEIIQLKAHFKIKYRTDPFTKADREELLREFKLNQQIQVKIAEQAATAPQQPTATGTTTPAAPAGSNLFGSTTPAPAFGAPAAPATGGLFGTPAPGGVFGAPAATTASGGAFGAPAPSTGLFGTPAATPGATTTATPTTPAAAPMGGGLFGGSTAPAPSNTTGGLFGGAPGTPGKSSLAAPAPAFGAAAPTPSAFPATPKSKSKSRSSRRR